ncbi:EAL domain-containing protein [Paenibacillus gansuensis]|uniref:EAL domain-containing protein n=1 Tax=Paenibacillus gansuensis TaxID=306542 RepID=A0ABW5PG21_9BACL
MGFSASVNKWKAKFGKAADPGAAKPAVSFPQDETGADPAVQHLQELRVQGVEPGLVILRFEDYRLLSHTYDKDKMDWLKAEIRSSIERLAAAYIAADDLLALRQFAPDEFGVFISNGKTAPPLYLHKIGDTLCSKLQSDMEAIMSGMEMGTVAFIHSHAQFDSNQGNTYYAFLNAYYNARMMFAGTDGTAYHPYRDDILAILEEENISVLAQPIMNLQSGDVFGWEVLTRGPRNTPFYSPLELFEYAFQTDLLIRMECLVTSKALLEIASREIKEQVFINVTAISLGHPIYLSFLLDQLKKVPQVAPTQLIFEITERHAIKDYHEMGVTIRKYRDHGFRFAVDDAGAGYSSLLTISELIPDIIKIDKSLIQNIDQISVKRSILKALMQFAQEIQCEVVAEGIERVEEAEVLFQHEVQMGQGYYFARPEPLNENTAGSRENRLEHIRKMQSQIRKLRETARE